MGMFSRLRSRPSLEAGAGTAFPLQQIIILALCRICEPIAFMSIFPYIYYMVQSFNITTDDTQISIYAGMVTSAFAIAEFSASIFWGWLSDRIGRKPVLLTGLAGTGISMLMFGFSKSLPIALLARTMGGLLNGNIGVIITTVGEVVTVEAHQSTAFAVMPFVWSIGSIIGAALGGSLADPINLYPGLFDSTGLFSRFRFLLPNLVCTAIVVCGLTIGFLFLEETHQDKRHRKDLGLKLGRSVVRRVLCRGSSDEAAEEDGISEDRVFCSADEKGDYHVVPTSPRMAPTEAATTIKKESEVVESREEPKVSWRNCLTRQIRLIVLSYGLLAFHTISMEQLLPILFASSETDRSHVYPFKFDAGFGLNSKTIGFILSLQGIIQMFAQIVVFPIVSQRFGSLMTFRMAVLSYPLLYFLMPYLALAPPNLRFLSIGLVLVWKVTAQAFSFPSQTIMLAKAAPSKRVLGTLNGIALSAASLARAIGPTVIGIIHATGRKNGYSIFSWWTCAVVAVLGAGVSLLMEEPESRTNQAPIESEACDEEKAEAEPLLVRLSADLEPAGTQPDLVDQRL